MIDKRAASILLPLLLVVGACGSGSEATSSDAGSDSGDANPDLPADQGAIGSLRVIVRHPDLTSDIEYEVGCFGDAFPVTPEVEGVDGAAGCELLGDSAVLALLVDGLPADQACTEIYGGPDEAFITGEINGKTIDATISRINGCEIDRWERLVGLIPPALGVTDVPGGANDGGENDRGEADRVIPGGGGPIASLRIIVRHPDLATDIEYEVGCLGDTFPVTPAIEGVDGAAGCALLQDEAIRDLLINGFPADQACTMQYGGPDEAFITGEIDGEAVDIAVTRTDGCQIAAWESLVGLLPPSIGVTE